jgi:hypothetical protein
LSDPDQVRRGGAIDREARRRGSRRFADPRHCLSSSRLPFCLAP